MPDHGQRVHPPEGVPPAGRAGTARQAAHQGGGDEAATGPLRLHGHPTQGKVETKLTARLENVQKLAAGLNIITFVTKDK